MRHSFGAFCQALAHTLADPGERSRHLPQGILAALRTLVQFDHSVTFLYCGNAAPVDLHDTFNTAERHVFVSLYQEGPFLLDPFFRAASDQRKGFWRMRELAPDRFYSSDYFHNYYVQTGLAEEVGFFVPLEGGATIALSLMRLTQSRVFSVKDVALLRDAAPLISALLTNCWHGVEKQELNASNKPAIKSVTAQVAPQVSAAGWGDLKLTLREAAIMDLILQGHSTEAIARRLDITRGTVKVHRRNAYGKLGIHTQAELLATYMNRVLGRPTPTL